MFHGKLMRIPEALQRRLAWSYFWWYVIYKWYRYSFCFFVLLFSSLSTSFLFLCVRVENRFRDSPTHSSLPSLSFHGFLVRSGCHIHVILVLVCLLPDTYHLFCRSIGTHCTRKTLSLTLSYFRIIRRMRLPFENPLEILSALLRQRGAVSLVGSCASSTVDTVHATVFSGSRSWFEGGYMCISRSPRIRQSLFPGFTVDACSYVSPVSRREYREPASRVVMAVVMVTRLAQANYFCCSLSVGPGARVFVA